MHFFQFYHNSMQMKAPSSMKVYTNGPVSIQGQVQNQLAQQKVQENEVNTFIKACRLMEQRVSKDIQTLTEHWEKYGYQVPRDAQRPNSE